jgi:hypothetical protein
MRNREYDAEDPAGVEAWIDASRKFAEGASGVARVVLGETRPGNIWETVQLPALEANPRVTKVVAVDPSTNEERTIFER